MAEVGQGLFLGDTPITSLFGNDFVFVNPFTEPSLDPDAEAFLTATGITDGTITIAINELVLDLKSNSLWTKMDAIYPFVGGTATTNKYNLKDPQDTDGAYRLSYTGTVTHDSDGFTTNGVNGYADTHLAPSAMGGGQNDVHMFYYMNDIKGGQSGIDIGSANAATVGLWSNSRNPSDVFNTRCNDTTTDGDSGITSTGGAFTISRLSSTSYTKSYNKTKTSPAVTSSSPSTLSSYIGAVNENGTATNFQNRTFSLVSWGSGLSDSEIDTLVDINETYQTTLGRFV